MNTTVLGGHGFIGRHLSAYLRLLGHNCWVPERNDPDIFNHDLGIVYYCIGLTADFRSLPFETIDAHVGVLKDIVERAKFDRLIYLSSTRVYANCEMAYEDQQLSVTSYRPNDLYNLSKLMGESIALNSGRKCYVARLSNVLGFDMGSSNFIGSILLEAKNTGSVRLQTSLTSCKDYIWIDDVISGLLTVSEFGIKPIYNIASGKNITHGEIVKLLVDRGVLVTVSDTAPVVMFPTIKTERLIKDTDWSPKPIIPRIQELIKTIL